MDRFGYKARRKIREITDRGAQKARVPNSPSLGATPGARFTGGTTITPDIDGFDHVDESGTPIRTFLFDVDFFDDETRFFV